MENLLKNNSVDKRKFSFKKEERLCSKKLIDKLFSEGESFLIFPLKVVYLKTSMPIKSPVQAAFSVGKRNFKLAVHRNQIKRKIREAYRLNKFSLYNELNDEQLTVFFIFIGKNIPDFKLIETAMKRGMKRLIKEIHSDN